MALYVVCLENTSAAVCPKIRSAAQFVSVWWALTVRLSWGKIEFIIRH